jgi:hypothetical protein
MQDSISKITKSNRVGLGVWLRGKHLTQHKALSPNPGAEKKKNKTIFTHSVNKYFNIYIQ